MPLDKEFLVVTAPIDQWITAWGVPRRWAYQVDSRRLDEHFKHAELLHGLDYKLTVRSARFGDSVFEFHENVTEAQLLANWAFRCGWEDAKVFLKQSTKKKKWRKLGQGIILLAKELEGGGMEDLMRPAIPLALTWAAAAAMDTLEKDIEREEEMETTTKAGKKATDTEAKDTGKANDPLPRRSPCATRASPQLKVGP